jgi:subtilisin family serine protease
MACLVPGHSAAGNSNADACLYSPSSEPSAITVGATTSSDARASYSNYGSCVDVFAPGSSITSAWYTSATATNTISGTSMASPHVAGIAALALSANPSASPSSVTQFIMNNSSLNKLSSIGTGSPNKLAYSMASGSPDVLLIQKVAIKSLNGSAKKAGKTWQAKVAVTVRDINTGANVSNASMTGLFSPGGASGCTTSSNGSCTMTSGSIATSSNLTKYAVTGLSGNNLSYDSTQNTATQITVAMP